MYSALIYHPGEQLSLAELMAARLDGHAIEVGPAFMPFDTLESATARALSLQRMLRGAEDALAFCGLSAAWIHGALLTPPLHLHVQRIGASFARPSRDPNLKYLQSIVREEHREWLAGVWVTTVEHTLAMLCRRPSPEHAAAAARMLLCFPELATAFSEHLGEIGEVQFAAAREEASALRAEYARLANLR